MTHGFIQRFLSCLLVISLLVIGGLAATQSLAHEFQHSHHQKATHGTVLCSWMCAAGQVLDTFGQPALIERSPITWAEPAALLEFGAEFSAIITSRGPPTHSTI